MSGWKQAFSLSQAEVNAAIPPGTVALIRHHQNEAAEVSSQNTHSTLRFPRPSRDPADPLNWPTWRKLAVLLVMALYAFVANFSSANISAALPLFNVAFPNDPQPFSNLTYLISVNTLFLGVANIFWVPMAHCLGRRAVLLVSTFLMTIGSIWCATSPTYKSLMAARIFQGIGAAASETVAPSLVGDVFFVDQRGRAMAIYTVFLCSGPLTGGLAGGYIAFGLGWTAVFYFTVALSALVFLSTLFLVPETTFQRKDQVLEGSQSWDMKTSDSKEEEKEVEIVRSASPVSNPEDYAPFTFARSLGFPKPRSGFFGAFFKPFLTLSFPATWVVMMQYGGLIGGIVTISTIGPQIVAAPPYSWGNNAGLINLGGVVGALAGGLYTFLVADASLKYQATRSRSGLSEPEDRLPIMFPALIIATGGFFVFGFVAQNPSPTGWVGLQFGYGMLTVGLMQIPSVDFNYLMDSYAQAAQDCFLMVTIMRSIIGFVMTFFIANWVADAGAAIPFSVFGGLMGFFCLMTIPLWLYGKRMRIATADRAANF